jgi:tetratricopeptide (TPR) repeat protein
VPILISLMIDLAAFGNVAALPKLRGVQDPENGPRVRGLLVNELEDITPPIWETLRCLAVARKGLTPELFESLMAGKGWSLDRCRGELGRLREATFSKPREGTDALFLHDALYEMFDELEPFPLLDPGRLLPLIVDYYEEQIRACEVDMSKCRAELRKLDLQERAAPDIPGLADQRRTFQERLSKREREWQRLQVEVVYYKLWYDVREGFERYARLDDEALKAHEFGFDVRLHDEILRYVNGPQCDDTARRRLPRDEFDRHCGLRWAKRHLARGDREGNERAARVARHILRTAESPLGGADAQADSLYQAEARLWGAEALGYLGQEQEAEKWLGEALVLLKRTRARRPYRQWRRNRLIGRAYNNLGYMGWKSGRYRENVGEYRAALPYFRKADIRDEMADTLNNLAYLYSVLGETDRAKALIEDARQLREELGQNYPLALSYNTCGEIHTAANEPEEAVAWCERARTIFSAMEDARGLGLAYIGLGRAYRKIGDKGKRGEYPFEQAQRAFEQAVEWLGKALNIFGGDEPSVREPYRLWETLNEWGSTYVDWAYLLIWHDLHDQADEKYRLAVQYQERAVQVAEEAGFVLQVLDSYDDLAQAYADWDKPEQAREYLGKVYRAVPKEYRLVEGVGFEKLPDPVEDGYWLVLGKYYLQRGIWAYNQADQAETPQEKDRFLDEATRHFALAMAYFQHFSPDLAHVNLTSRAMYRRFRTLKLEQLERLRREVRDVARRYRVNLGRLLDTLDDTLGSPIRSL